MEEIPDPVVLPCGCFINCSIEEGIKTMTMSACKVNCINLQNALQLAEEANLPVEERIK